MRTIQHTLQDQLDKIRQNQYTRQRDIINAFDIIQNLAKQIQTLKLPNKIIKDNNTLKQQSKINTKINTKTNTKHKIEKQEIIKKEKNLFKRFVSHVVFRNIMQFLSIKDLKQLRLISYFTNQLIENNIEYLIYFKQQRTNYLESLNITKYQKPEIPGLRNVENIIRNQLSRKGYINKVSQRLLSFCSLTISLQAAGSKSQEYLSKFDILKSALKELRNLQFRWYGFYEKDKRMIKNFISKQGIGDLTSHYENGFNFADLNKYIKNLNDFTSQQNYKVICEAFNKNQLISIISKDMKCLNRLLMKIRAKSNFLFKISDLGNLFFKLTLSYCSLNDVMNSRLVCKKFNQAFLQNSSYHYQISANRIQKQINSIQTNFNLSLTQDEFLYKTKEQNSLMEIFYCIYQNQNQNDQINTKDFLLINSQYIADFVYKSTNDDQVYLKTLEILKERLGIDILDERNYNTFLQKLQKVKESLQDYHIKLPKLQQQLTLIENKNLYYEM